MAPSERQALRRFLDSNAVEDVMKEQQTFAVPGWVELHNLSAHTDVESRTPQGYYVRGMVGGITPFEPTSEVLGTAFGRPPENSVPGWFELTTLTPHRDMEAVLPVEPYVHGVFDDEGHFYPDEPPSVQRRIASTK